MKKLRTFISAFCTCALLLSAFPAISASAAGRISYIFSGDEKDKSGFAEGKIKLSGFDENKHYLWWADESGALDGYYEITDFKGDAQFSFGDHAAIPAGADRLIVTSDKKNTSTKKAEAEFIIPAEKRLRYTADDTNYTFMNYSDIHIDEAKNVFYRHSELHWQKALETAAARKADFIVTAGDNITNADGPVKEFDKFQEILANSPYTGYIYEASGNHELRAGGTPEQLLRTFSKATGLNGNSENAETADPYYYIEEPESGDIFIFMALEYEYSPDDGDEFSDEQLNWLEGLLKNYYGKNRNITIIQHALIEGYGAGDDEDNFYTVPLMTEYKSTVRFRDIISRYPDLVWISGHTHIAFKYGYNYSNMNDTSCNMIHDSSVCCPTLLRYSTHKLSYIASEGEEYEDFTEGYCVQVFDDCTVWNGENLYHDKIYPSATYITEGCRKTFDKKERNNEEISEEHSGFSTADELGIYAETVISAPVLFKPAEKADENDTKLLQKSAKKLLGELYTFSSYNDYQDLKRLAKAEDANFAELAESYRRVLPYTRVGNINVYFTDTLGWGKAYADLSSASGSALRREMTHVGEDSDGNMVFRMTVNYRKFNTVVFTDGTEKGVTEPQTLTGEENKNFVLNANDPESPYFCLVNDYVG